MKFWDSTALMPLLVNEASSDARRLLFESDPAVVAWWGTVVECESALARRLQSPGVTAAEAHDARERLQAIAEDWIEVSPENQVRARARRLARVHPLRAADAFQLAAALVAVSEYSDAIEFVCNDRRLAEAARLEGFNTV